MGTEIIIILAAAIGFGAGYLVCKRISHLHDGLHFNKSILNGHLIFNKEAIDKVIAGKQAGSPESGFFPIDVLETYIDFVKHEAELKSIEVTGFEIFFANPNTTRTFIIYPTVMSTFNYIDELGKPSVMNIDMPFDPQLSTADNPMTLQNLKTLYDNQPQLDNIDKEGILNRSQMSPPRRPRHII